MSWKISNRFFNQSNPNKTYFSPSPTLLLFALPHWSRLLRLQAVLLALPHWSRLRGLSNHLTYRRRLWELSISPWNLLTALVFEERLQRLHTDSRCPPQGFTQISPYSILSLICPGMSFEQIKLSATWGCIYHRLRYPWPYSFLALPHLVSVPALRTYLKVGWRRADILKKGRQHIPLPVLPWANAYYGQTWGPMWKHLMTAWYFTLKYSDSPGKKTSSLFLSLAPRDKKPCQQG